MRRLFTGLIVLCLVWCGWWAFGASQISQRLAQAREDLLAMGWQIEGQAAEVTGFPLVWRSAVSDLTALAPTNTLRITSEGPVLRAAPHRPFAASLTLPEAPIKIETLLSTYLLRMKDGAASVALRPGLPFSLKTAEITSNAWQLNTPSGNMASADNLSAVLQQNAEARDTYLFTFAAEALTPGDILRQDLGLPADWPRPMQTSEARMTLRVDNSVQRETPDQRLAILRQLNIERFNFIWGQLHLDARGSVTISADGLPAGDVTLQVKDWRTPYALAKQSGAIKPEVQFQTGLMLNALSNIGGDPDTLDLTLTFRDGAMFMGPIPLGPAPRILF